MHRSRSHRVDIIFTSMFIYRELLFTGNSTSLPRHAIRGYRHHMPASRSHVLRYSKAISLLHHYARKRKSRSREEQTTSLPLGKDTGDTDTKNVRNLHQKAQTVSQPGFQDHRSCRGIRHQPYLHLAFYQCNLQGQFQPVHQPMQATRTGTTGKTAFQLENQTLPFSHQSGIPGRETLPPGTEKRTNTTRMKDSITYYN